MEEKTWAVPEELQKIITAATAMEELRDKYVTRPFGYRNAKKAAIEARIAFNDFFLKVVELYPNLKTSRLVYLHNTKCVAIKAD